MWNGVENVRTPQLDVTPLKPLWLISKTPFRLNVEGETAKPNTPQTFKVRAGWNLVANPYLFSVPFGNIHVEVGDEVLPLDHPRASNLVPPRFWRWTVCCLANVIRVEIGEDDEVRVWAEAE